MNSRPPAPKAGALPNCATPRSARHATRAVARSTRWFAVVRVAPPGSVVGRGHRSTGHRSTGHRSNRTHARSGVGGGRRPRTEPGGVRLVATATATATEAATRAPRASRSGCGGRRAPSRIEPTTPATTDATRMPTFASSCSATTSKAKPATKIETVKPMPAMPAMPSNPNESAPPAAPPPAAGSPATRRPTRRPACRARARSRRPMRSATSPPPRARRGRAGYRRWRARTTGRSPGSTTGAARAPARRPPRPTRGHHRGFVGALGRRHVAQHVLVDLLGRAHRLRRRDQAEEHPRQSRVHAPSSSASQRHAPTRT